MTNPVRKKYRTTKAIVIPKGHAVVYVGHMKHDIREAVLAVVRAGPDSHFDWFMGRDDALEAGLIEEA
jgi:5-formaminoimidazole-4-carboxamide-1-beta-D-ribofuranosyl 5'-monophosphate synthetase